MTCELFAAATSGGSVAASASQLFRGAFDLSRVSLGTQELVYSPLTRAAHVLPTFAVRLVQGCRAFATLDEHAANLCRDLNLGPQQAPEISQQLGALAGAGFLLSRQQLLAKCRPSNSPAPPITTLGIPTRNRPRQLERCLTSYVENNRRHARTLEYVIVDDSDDPANRDAHRQLLHELKTRHGVSVAYAGPEERSSFAAALVQHTGLDPADVRFAILNDGGFPVATGASRNALLLHCVGEVFLQVDDDTVAQLAPVPDVQRGLALCSDYDPTQFWFLAPDEPVPLVSEWSAPCVVAVHEQLLGRRLGDCLNGQEANLNLDRAGTSLFRRLDYGEGAVLATAAGVMGDSGMGSPGYLLALDEPSRSRLLGSEAVYQHALARQQVLRAVTQSTISDGGFCMALNLGLDQRDLLPPFPPVQRNQDGVFGALLRACWSNAYFGFLPWTLLHQASEERRLSLDKVWRSTVHTTSGQILEALVASYSPGPNQGKPLASLQALGRSLEDWGSCHPGDLEELVRLLLWSQAGRSVAQLEQRLRATGGQPAFWADDVQRLLALWRDALPTKDYVVPRDLVQRFGTGAWGRFNDLVRCFGRLLRVWPDLVAAAKDLRTRGQRLALEV